MMGSSTGIGMGFGGIFGIIFWILIIVAIVALVKWMMARSSESGSASSKTALQVLEERYARGEIEKNEFEQKKRDLSE